MRATDGVLAILVGLLVCAWAAPVVLALVDAWCWLVIGHQLTGFDWWTKDRAGAMWAWLLVGIIPALAAAGLMARLDIRR